MPNINFTNISILDTIHSEQMLALTAIHVFHAYYHKVGDHLEKHYTSTIRHVRLRC